MIFFKFPFGENFFSVDNKPDCTNVSFVSFTGENQLDFEGNVKEINDLPEVFSDDLSNITFEFPNEDQEKYVGKISSVIDFIKENDLKKLVIARQKLVPYGRLNGAGKINLTQTFLNVCRAYPNAFAYFFNKDGKCWIGAFSEVLGKFNKETSEFETMSLAGTLPVNENWTAKEIEEQKPVTDYISNILKNYSEHVEQSETTDHISGNIKHLRTDIKAKTDKKDLEKLISDLHPTPAVCGIPKDFCKNAIEKFEVLPRQFYAGYIRVETESHIQYFVNLRCAEFTKNAAIIYVGGGITAQSNPEKEWQETELKSEAILKNIAIS